ncbi:MAG TPA: sugar phosphate isomerase/epimerase family protein, partial [Gemmatimonadales bacterium]
MKLAISNIAWSREQDDVVATLLREAGVEGIEIAPTAIWPDPVHVAPDEARRLRDWWGERGLKIVALQALLFGRPDLRLFGSDAQRRELLDHLTAIFDLAARLGAGPLVFGSPRNRLAGSLPADQAFAIAAGFFREAGTRAAARQVTLCIEPNPADYGCDFVTTVPQAMALVREAGSPGFALHVDGGELALNHEPLPGTITAAKPVMRHFHASEPFLTPLGSGASDHAAYASALRTAGYEGWVSLEMKAPEGGIGAL